MWVTCAVMQVIQAIVESVNNLAVRLVMHRLHIRGIIHKHMRFLHSF